jgi:hypothetical protein
MNEMGSARGGGEGLPPLASGRAGLLATRLRPPEDRLAPVAAGAAGLAIAAISLFALALGWAMPPVGAVAAEAALVTAAVRRARSVGCTPLAVLALPLSFSFLAGALIGLAQAGPTTLTPHGPMGPPGFGWKLYVLVVTGLLMGYVARDREPAPAGFLLLVGGAGVAYGLRPGGTGPTPPTVAPTRSVPPPPSGAPPSPPPGSEEL